MPHISTKRKAETCQDSSGVPANKMSRHSSVADAPHSEDDEASSSHCEDTSKLVMIRRYCLIFADDADESWFEGDTPPVVARTEAIVSRVRAAAAANGQQLVPHKFTHGVKPYALNVEDGELWANIPESAVDAVATEFGQAIEAIVEEYAF